MIQHEIFWFFAAQCVWAYFSCGKQRSQAECQKRFDACSVGKNRKCSFVIELKKIYQKHVKRHIVKTKASGLATLPEGPGLAFDILKVFKILKINYGCFKTVKLVKKVIIVINRVPTNYLLRKKIRKTDFYYQNQLAWPTNLATSTVTINWILIKKSTKQLTTTYVKWGGSIGI